MGLRGTKRPRETRATARLSSVFLASIFDQLVAIATHVEQLQHRHDNIIAFLIQIFPNLPQELQGEINGANPSTRIVRPMSLVSTSKQLDILYMRIERLGLKLDRILAFIDETNYNLPQELLV